MRKPLVVLITVAAGSLLAGGGIATASTSEKKPPVELDGAVSAHGTATVKGSAVSIEADDLYFEKTYLKGKAGKTIGVTVENKGDTTHTFTIDAQDIDEELEPGESIDVDVTIPANGKIANFSCRFHVSSGMQGAFFSKKGGASKAKGNGTPATTGGGRYGY
jgi:plastocyanin